MTINTTMSRLALLFRSLLLALLIGMLSAPMALAQSQCEKELAEAEAKYQLGRLDEAIVLVNRCLEKDNLGPAERERSYLLLGKAYHAKRLLDSAKEYLRKLLEMIPSWRPDPEADTPSFQKLAEEVIKEVETERQAQQQQALQKATQQSEPDSTPPSGGSKKWWWIGGGALAVGTVAFLIFQGEEKSPRLPDPPALPRK